MDESIPGFDFSDAHAFPNAAVVGADLSDDALDVARRNVADYHLEDRIDLVKSDVFSGLGGRTFDLIISNPPYVTPTELAELAPEKQSLEQIFLNLLEKPAARTAPDPKPAPEATGGFEVLPDEPDDDTDKGADPEPESVKKEQG